MTAVDDLPPGWLTRFRRGVVSGATVVLLALIVLCIPALVAWLMPGGDSLSATTACKVAALTLLSSLHAGVTIQATVLTVPPLLVTGLVVGVLSGPARRIDGASGPFGLIVGFTVAAMLLARWSRIGTSYVSVHRTAAAALLVSAAVVLVARGVPRVRRRFGHRCWSILRAGWSAVLVQLAAGTALVALSLVVHFSDAAAIQRAVAPGASGLAVMLLAVAAIPNAGLLGAAYLGGSGFHLGATTSVSILSTRRGEAPAFPLLAAVPHAGGLSGIGLVAAVLAGLAVGAVPVAILAGRGRRPGQVLTDLLAAALVAGVLGGVLAGFARGDLGHASLRGIGASGPLVAGSGVGTVFAGALVAWGLRTGFRRLRPSRSQATPPVARPADQPALVPEPAVAVGTADDWAVQGRFDEDDPAGDRMDTDELPDLREFGTSEPEPDADVDPEAGAEADADGRASEAARSAQPDVVGAVGSDGEPGSDRGDGPLRHAG